MWNKVPLFQAKLEQTGTKTPFVPFCSEQRATSGTSKRTPVVWSSGSAAGVKSQESPVSSDTVISRSHEVVKIGQLCEMIGLNMDQLELYGD